VSGWETHRIRTGERRAPRICARWCDKQNDSVLNKIGGQTLQRKFNPRVSVSGRCVLLYPADFLAFVPPRNRNPRGQCLDQRVARFPVKMSTPQGSTASGTRPKLRMCSHPGAFAGGRERLSRSVVLSCRSDPIPAPQ